MLDHPQFQVPTIEKSEKLWYSCYINCQKLTYFFWFFIYWYPKLRFVSNNIWKKIPKIGHSGRRLGLFFSAGVCSIDSASNYTGVYSLLCYIKLLFAVRCNCFAPTWNSIWILHRMFGDYFTGKGVSGYKLLVLFVVIHEIRKKKLQLFFQILWISTKTTCSV